MCGFTVYQSNKFYVVLGKQILQELRDLKFTAG